MKITRRIALPKAYEFYELEAEANSVQEIEEKLALLEQIALNVRHLTHKNEDTVTSSKGAQPLVGKSELRSTQTPKLTVEQESAVEYVKQHYPDEIRRTREAMNPDITNDTSAALIIASEKRLIHPSKPIASKDHITYTVNGDQAVFLVPYDWKDDFKKVIKDKTDQYPRWNKEKKAWTISVDAVTNSVLDALQSAGMEVMA